MLIVRTMRGPSTGSLKIPVRMVLPSHTISRGRPTFSETRRPVVDMAPSLSHRGAARTRIRTGSAPGPQTRDLTGATRPGGRDPVDHTMEYLIDFLITIPDDAPQAEVRERSEGETTRVAQLAAEGHALRVWKPLPDDGRRRALGLYRADSDADLEAILASLPLRPWMEITVTAL